MPREIHRSPAGPLHWAKVLGEPHENKADPSKPRSWGVELHFDQEDPRVLVLSSIAEEAFFAAHGKDAKASKNAWPFSQVLDDKEKPTGVIRFRFSRNETGKTGRVFDPPTVVDARKQRWPADLLIGNGSIGKVAFTTFSWTDSYGKCGVSFGLEGVQILEHVPYGGKAIDAFDEEEGCYLGGEPGGEAPEEEAPF